MAAGLRIARSQPGTSAGRVPLSLSPHAEAIHAHITTRQQELEQLSPEASRLDALVLEALHGSLHGRIKGVRGTRSEEYRRQQLLGVRPLSTTALCYLALEAPEAVAGALHVLARALGYRMEPDEPDSSATIAREIGKVLERVGTLGSEVAQALEDGRVTPEEAVALDGQVHALRVDLAALEAVVHDTAAGYRGQR